MDRLSLQSKDPPKTRPLSPHLQIYRPQLTSVLSILHRFTGIGLCLGHVLWIVLLVNLAFFPEGFCALQKAARTPLGELILLGWMWAFFYHAFSGLRHLCWDYGWGFSLPWVYRSGWLSVSLATVATVWNFWRLF